MSRKILTLILIAAMLCLLCACGGKRPKEPTWESEIIPLPDSGSTTEPSTQADTQPGETESEGILLPWA